MKKTAKKNLSPMEQFDAERCAKPAKSRKAKGGKTKATPDVDTKVEAAKAGRDTGERGAKGGQPVTEGGKAMSLMDAAVNILSQGTGDPMRCKDIVDMAVQRGLWTPRTGKTPASTLYAAILREIAAKGDASRFVKTERGKFALKDSAYMREAAAKSRKA